MTRGREVEPFSRGDWYTWREGEALPQLHFGKADGIHYDIDGTVFPPSDRLLSQLAHLTEYAYRKGKSTGPISGGTIKGIEKKILHPLQEIVSASTPLAMEAIQIYSLGGFVRHIYARDRERGLACIYDPTFCENVSLTPESINVISAAAWEIAADPTIFLDDTQKAFYLADFPEVITEEMKQAYEAIGIEPQRTLDVTQPIPLRLTPLKDPSGVRTLGIQCIVLRTLEADEEGKQRGILRFREENENTFFRYRVLDQLTPQFINTLPQGEVSLQSLLEGNIMQQPDIIEAIIREGFTTKLHESIPLQEVLRSIFAAYSKQIPNLLNYDGFIQEVLLSLKSKVRSRFVEKLRGKLGSFYQVLEVGKHTCTISSGFDGKLQAINNLSGIKFYFGDEYKGNDKQLEKATSVLNINVGTEPSSDPLVLNVGTEALHGPKLMEQLLSNATYD